MTLTHLRERSRRAAPPALLVLTLALAACGGDEADDPPADDGSADAVAEDLPPEVAAAVAEAEELGLEFITSHDEIVRRAEEIGALHAYISSQIPEDITEAFQAEYPNIDTVVEDFGGTDAHQRFLLEAESGALSGLDTQQAPAERYLEFHEFFAPYDFLGMAEAGILDIPGEMVDPELRNTVAIGSQIAGYAYNPDLIDGSKIPDEWEGFCDTSFLDGRQFVLDLRPTNVAPLVAEWGQERVNELAECLAATDPILVRGNTEALTRLVAGELPLHIFTNYQSAVAVSDEAGGALEVKLIEPVPVRLANVMGVMNEEISGNPYAGILFIEFMAGPKGQELLDADPLKSSIYAENSKLKEAIGDRETAVADFDHFAKMEDYMSEIVEHLGFPQQ